MEVEAIKNLKQLEKMKKMMKEDNKIKELVLFVLGINTALRISDILDLKYVDVLNIDRTIKQTIEIIEKKTKKRKKFMINENVKTVLKMLIKKENEVKFDDYIFKSESNRVALKNQAWSRQYAFEFLNRYARAAGISGNIGTHSMRKSFGFHAYQSGVDIAIIQKIMNHSSQETTAKYIGITHEDINNVYLNIVNL